MNEALETTPLHDLHCELGARMVPFAGYRMPVQYPDGIIAEHRHTRSHAGLFDVSHMGQLAVEGPGAARSLEALVPADLVDLPVGRQCYTVLTNADGGILDDLIVTRQGDARFFLVVNAACKQADRDHIAGALTDCELTPLPERALLALQGPAARGVIAELAAPAAALAFMRATVATVDGIDCYVTCSGYTGEDGFEISCPAADAEALARRLLGFDAVAPIGLGARDSLRLEAGLCLYGHDIDTRTTPVEAGLAWSIAKARRAGGGRAGGFPGAERILAELADGPGRRRVGLTVDGRAPVREGAELADANGIQIGAVTSGGFSPTLEHPIAMGYVTAAAAKPETTLTAMVRGKPRAVTVAKLPFVEHCYRRS